jgi:hypothetical protein
VYGFEIVFASFLGRKIALDMTPVDCVTLIADACVTLRTRATSSKLVTLNVYEKTCCENVSCR